MRFVFFCRSVGWDLLATFSGPDCCCCCAHVLDVFILLHTIFCCFIFCLFCWRLTNRPKTSRFGLEDLIEALADGDDPIPAQGDGDTAVSPTRTSTTGAELVGSAKQSWGQPLQSQATPSPPGDPALLDADALLDIIPAPVSSKPLFLDRSSASSSRRGAAGEGLGPYSFEGEDEGESAMAAASAPSVLANIHMRLLDFLAWDRTRAVKSGRDAKQEAYWRTLVPSVNNGGGIPGGGGAGGGGGLGAAASNGEAGAGQGPLGDDDEFGGMPETTLPGLRDSRELVQATPHGFPELLRLVAIHREGVFRRVEARRTAAARGFAGLGLGLGREGGEGGERARALQARVLDPLGEVMRVLRHVMRSEEARPFLEPASDADVGPDGMLAGESSEGDGSGLGGGGGVGREGGEGGEGKADLERDKVKRPLDLGTILKRGESGWYDLDAGAQVKPSLCMIIGALRWVAFRLGKVRSGQVRSYQVRSGRFA